MLSLLGAVLAGTGCSTPTTPPLERYEFERPQMGLPFRLALYASDGGAATNAADAVWARIAGLNAILSDYEADSELSRLSRSSGRGEWIPLSADLARVLVAAQEISRASDGAFDVTVGPLVQLWRRARRQRELPAPELLERARAATVWTNLVLRRHGAGWEAQLLKPDMRLDLGGIAKGYALDEAAKMLKARRVSRFLISGGGDLVVGDPPPKADGWTVEVGTFDSPDAPAPRTLRLRDIALATSGDAFQRAEIGGVRYSHIVHPQTGLGLTDHRLITVTAATGMLADALSTAASVLPPEAALELVRDFGARALILRAPGHQVEEYRSPDFFGSNLQNPSSGPVAR